VTFNKCVVLIKPFRRNKVHIVLCGVLMTTSNDKTPKQI